MPHPTKKYRLLTCFGSAWRLTETSYRKYMRATSQKGEAPDLSHWPGAAMIPMRGDIRNVTDITPAMARDWLEEADDDS